MILNNRVPLNWYFSIKPLDFILYNKVCEDMPFVRVRDVCELMADAENNVNDPRVRLKAF